MVQADRASAALSRVVRVLFAGAAVFAVVAIVSGLSVGLAVSVGVWVVLIAGIAVLFVLTPRQRMISLAVVAVLAGVAYWGIHDHRYGSCIVRPSITAWLKTCPL
jgi:hypothetical protein